MYTFITIGLGVAWLLGSVWTAVVSHREDEPRAARIAWALAVAVPLIHVAVAWLAFPGSTIVFWLLIVVPMVALVLWMVPVRGPRQAPAEPRQSIDERVTMFARMALRPGTERFDAHYDVYPEHREADDHWRRHPGLLGGEAAHHDALRFAAAESTFAAVEPLHDLVDGEPAATIASIDPDELTRFLVGWTRKLGAMSAGVADLRDEHWYSTVGRRDPWGAPAALPHQRALAFTVEMDKAALDTAPRAPVIMESAQQYLAAGTIAVQVAALLRSLGWEARAHIDANYRVVCPLVARDAGLGEIGRMGLLMTPTVGPRCRIGVVTTTAPLMAAPPTRDEAVLDFCTICEKCADACPAGAIPRGPRADVDGVRRWRIDQERCFEFWCRVGTDCGRCVQVCPYSHPDNTLHRLVRSGVGRSAVFRRAALRLDDLTYGRRPASRMVENWPE